MALYLPYFTCLFLILPFITTAQTHTNITLGSYLVAGNPASQWISKSKDFAFGFQEIEPHNFLLAIWFDQIPEKTMTWYANRDNLAPSGSKVELTADRHLVLTDPRGQKIWRAKISAGKVAYAALLDTGNFVLATEASNVLWQSFDEPSDTILPSQILKPGSHLLARYSENNYSSGRFTFEFSLSGNLGISTTNYPFFNSVNRYYWLYEGQGSGSQVVFNQSGLSYLVAKNGSILIDMFSEIKVSGNVLYQRVTLEYDGVFRHYVYPTPSSHSSGWSVKSFVPDNICDVVIQNTGSGVCGYNSYCQFGNDSRVHCLCPPGYSLLDQNNEMGGCNQDFPPQSCQDASQEKNQFDLKKLKAVDWPLSDYEHFQNVSVDWCREVCLDDCFCAVGIFRDGGDCWKKKLPLSNGRSGITVERTAFIKVRINGGFNERSKNTNRILTALLGASGLGNILLVAVILAGVCFIVYHKNLIQDINQTKSNGDYSVRAFSYEELNEATNRFKDEIGRGAFAVVFRGIMGGDPGTQTFIAVKRLDCLSEDADREFKAEVNAIGHTHHKNLVRLIGFCCEGQNRMLVYEFMTNGPLSNFIYGRPKPAWMKRLQIMQDIARGLLYLHEDCDKKIIHCDIKPQNILLDDDHNARISDFGLAKLLRLDQTQTNTIARGTRGYAAPEWFRNMPITAKVDVYSFGILLLEIICCQRNVHAGNDEEDSVILLTDLAIDCYQINKIDDLVNDDVEALTDKHTLEKAVKIVIWCIQDDPNLRPTMKMVSQMLEGLVEVPEPPCPTSYSASFTT